MRRIAFSLLSAAALLITNHVSAYADVSISNGPMDILNISVSGTISSEDGLKLQSMADTLVKKSLTIRLDSDGGDVYAAMQMGKIIRAAEGTVLVGGRANCFSSCALIYISGVTRVNGGTVGLHRPYFSGGAMKQVDVERYMTKLLSDVRQYVADMGITYSFYERMVNTEPSTMLRYNFETIQTLVPAVDPTWNEVITSFSAKKYGLTTLQVRQREKAGEKCAADYECMEAINWGIPKSEYTVKIKATEAKCPFPDLETKYGAMSKRQFRENPLVDDYFACIRKVMAAGVRPAPTP